MDTPHLDVTEFRRFGLLLGAFFILTPLTLIATLASLVSISKSARPAPVVQTTQPVRILAALPEKEAPVLSMTVNVGDARSEIVRQYLERYDSPLTPFSEHIVKMADKYELDFRLIPAIAQQESNLCKKIPENSFNCWGWGIHKRGTLGFESYEEGVEIVSAGIKSEYINKGLTTPEEIMSKYTPSSPGSWAAGVGAFMAAME